MVPTHKQHHSLKSRRRPTTPVLERHGDREHRSDLSLIEGSPPQHCCEQPTNHE